MMRWSEKISLTWDIQRNWPLHCNDSWRIPIQHITAQNKQSIKDQMDGLTFMNDPAQYDDYIQDAATGLLQAKEPIKHLIFLGDGDAKQHDVHEIVARAGLDPGAALRKQLIEMVDLRELAPAVLAGLAVLRGLLRLCGCLLLAGAVFGRA